MSALATTRKQIKLRKQSFCQFGGCRNVTDDLVSYFQWNVCLSCYRLITAERLRTLGVCIGGPNPWAQQSRTARVEMCFAALGVSPSCTEDELKDAWRKVAKAHHPDQGGTHEMFILMQEAYELAQILRGFGKVAKR